MLPEAYPGSGFLLLPKSAIAAVVDTKTYFSTPKVYAAKPLFNLMNNSRETQNDFLGSGIEKFLFIARSNRSPLALSSEGLSVGMRVFCLAQAQSTPVADADERLSICRIDGANCDTTGLKAFREAILQSVLG